MKTSLLAASCSVFVFAAFACTATDGAPEPTRDAGVDAGGIDARDEPDAEPPCAPPTKEPVTHEGDVAADERWNAESVHVIEGDLNVRGGARLTIEPCVEVRVAAGKHINVAYPGTPNTGTLIAEGTKLRPIRIVGKNGARWSSVYVNAPGTARFAYATFENGGEGAEHGATLDVLGDSVMPADPALFVDHVTIKGSQGAGVWLQRGATFAEGSTDLTVVESGDESNPYPVEITEHAIDRLPSGSYTGNHTDEILLRSIGAGTAGSGLTVDATLRDRGVPYHVGTSDNDHFSIGGAEADSPLATLTIEPGVVMKFAPKTAFRVQTFIRDATANAVIRAQGTAAKPIVFTSASKTPAAGDWRGLWFGGKAHPNDVLDHVRIEYAGAACDCVLTSCSASPQFKGAVILTGQPPSAFLTNSVIKASAGNGITQGFDGTFVSFRPTNTFEDVAACEQILPRQVGGACPNPKPSCDGL